MNRNVREALERVERAQTFSRQPRLGAAVDYGKFFSSFYKWVKQNWESEPPYQADSRNRDKWLSEAWMKEPHIAGVINTVTSIDRNREWNLTGGRNIVKRFSDILRSAEDGEGWRYFMGRCALSFYTSDLGAVTEIGRDGESGPLRAIYNVDPTKCRLTGKVETPLSYTPTEGKEQFWKPDDYFRTTALPTIREEFRGLGFCALSRVWNLVRMMIAIYEHDMEQLGAKAPKGLLLLQNISEQQWLDAMKARDVQMSKLERDYFGGVAVLAQEGIDQIDAKLVALSQLPTGFDLNTVVKLLMVGIALGFGYDPIEFYPIETGALGRSRESELQHQKATGKGGVEFIRTFQDRIQGELPPTVFFEFEQRDVNGEILEAQVQQAWATVFQTYYDKGTGVLSLEETRQLMVEQGLIPSEWTLVEEEVQIDSTGEQRSWLNNEATWRSAFTAPMEPIVTYSSKNNKMRMLAPSGYWLIQKHHRNITARAVYDEMPIQEFREVFSHRVFPVLTLRQDEEILYEDDDLTITEEDVTRALREGKKRVGAEFGAMLMAEPVEDEE